jgi:hypothetical protein
VTEAEWDDCEDPKAMLAFVRARASERAVRLLGCACCRRAWDRLGESQRAAVVLAERYADGLVGPAALAEASERARQDPPDGRRPALDPVHAPGPGRPRGRRHPRGAGGGPGACGGRGRMYAAATRWTYCSVRGKPGAGVAGSTRPGSPGRRPPNTDPSIDRVSCRPRPAIRRAGGFFARASPPSFRCP